MHVVPLTELDDDLFASALAIQQRDEMATDPAIPPITGPELLRFAHHDRTEGNRHERFAVIDGDRARALVHLELELDEANAHRANIEMFGAAVDRDAGTIGLIAALDIAEADNRTVITGWGPNTDGGHHFWTSMGASLDFRERVSALDTTAVDAALMDRWITEGSRRAPDVEIVRWVDACPDEYMTPWIESQMAMNDMPHEGLDINDWNVDVDDVRQEEETMRTLGLRVMSVLALDDGGRAAGHTRVHVNPTRPSASYQWDTAVVDRHRGRGIGKRVKAEMWRWLRTEEPDATRLTTGNAQSNDAMLAINVAMGYEPVIEYGAWQTSLAEMRAALS
ncbi:MAG: GNAT family N-acetyltransferase [Acidimicrobiales bacterium]